VLAGAAVVLWRARTGDTGAVERTVPIESVTLEGPVLRVAFLVGSDGCGSSAGVVAEEADTAVRLTAKVRYDTRDGRSICPLAGQRVTEEVRLSRPLGDRDLVDGKTGRPLAVPGPPPLRDPA
jgi:hypothetical protein